MQTWSHDGAIDLSIEIQKRFSQLEVACWNDTVDSLTMFSLTVSELTWPPPVIGMFSDTNSLAAEDTKAGVQTYKLGQLPSGTGKIQ